MIWDAIVVGARVAGASAAMLLARAGQKVLLVDRAEFPSDTLSTLYTGPVGTALLTRWGLIEKLDAPRLRGVRWRSGDLSLQGTAYSGDGVTHTVAARRTVLDAALTKAAVAAGAELRTAVTFEDVLRDGQRVVGIRAHSRDGAFEERARIVIGADGKRSKVAEAVGAEAYGDKPVTTCNYYGFFDLGPGEWLDLVTGDGYGVATVPTNDGLTLVTVSLPIERFAAMKADPEKGLYEALAPLGELGQRVRAARRAERVMGTSDLPGYFKKPFGPGWALIGDAGYTKDPVSAQGISDALWSADRVAAAILEDRPDALADYAAARDERFYPFAEWTHRVARLKGMSPRVETLMRAIARRPEAISQFLGVYASTVSPIEFFSDENAAKLLA